MGAPCLIAVAPNGARRTRADHSAVPITPEELAETAAQCAKAGASMIHLHVRDASGAHSLDPARYREAIAAVDERVGDQMVIQITTEACGVYAPAEQIAAVEALKPQACSVALRELCPSDSPADRQTYAAFLADCRAEGVAVQHILYGAADVDRFLDLVRGGLPVSAAPQVLLVVGRYSAPDVSWRSELVDMVRALTVGATTQGETTRGATTLGGASEDALSAADRVHWAVCGFGVDQLLVTTAAAALGGHVRVGFENGLLLPDGREAPSNAHLVARMAHIANQLARPPMPPAQARAFLTAP